MAVSSRQLAIGRHKKQRTVGKRGKMGSPRQKNKDKRAKIKDLAPYLVNRPMSVDLDYSVF